MTVTRTTTPALGIDPRAVRLAAADAGVSVDRLVLVRRERHGKSDLAFVSAGAPAAPTHVIKSEHQAVGWSPWRQFEGLRFAQGLADPAARLGALRPVGFGADPPFLVSRYQPGRSVRAIVDAAIRDGRSEDAGTAGRSCALIGLWLSRLRAPGCARANGMSWAAVRSRLVESAARAGAITGGGEVFATLPARVDRLIGALGAEGVRRAGVSLPAHGDLRPQNFLLDDAGVLYPVDLESFDWRPLAPDLARLRFSFELAAIQFRGRGAGPRGRATRLWGACVQSLLVSGGDGGFELVCYLLRVLDRLNWAARPGSGLGRAAPRAILKRLRERLWIRDRQRWLRDLPADLDAAVDHFRNDL